MADWARWLARKGIGDEWLRINGLFSEVDTSPEHQLRVSVFPETGWAGFNYTGLPRRRGEDACSSNARATACA